MSENDVKQKVTTGAFWSLLEQLGAKCTALIIEIVLARILMPEDYGIVALAAVFITIANTITNDGLSLALVQKKEADDVDFSTCFYLNLAVSLAMYFAIFFSAPYMASFYDSPMLSDVLRVLGVSLPVSSVNSIQRAFATRHMMFRRFFVSSTIGYICSGIAGISMAYMGCGVWSLAAQTILSALFDTLILWFTVKWRPIAAFSLRRLCGLWSFGWKILTSNLLYQACIQLRAGVIGKKYNSSDLAFFNRGELIPALVACTADKAMQTALFPAMSQVQNDYQSVRGMLSRFVKVGCFLIFPSMMALAVVAKPLVALIFTDKWLPCVPFILAFCVCYSLQTLQSASLLALRAVGKSGLTLAQDCIKRTVDIALLLVSINFGPIAIACSCIWSGLFAVFINALPCKKIFNYGVVDQVKDIAPIALRALLAGGAACCLGIFDLPAGFLLFLQLTAMILAYIGLSFFAKDESLDFIVSIAKGFLGRG